MAPTAIYLDECSDHRLIDGPRAAGINLMTVVDADATGADDESQLVLATQHNRLRVSQNQIDFRRLHARFQATGRSHAGIILVPQTIPFRRLEHRVHLLADWVGTFPEHRSRLFTWADLQQQIIHGFRLPSWDEEVVRDAVGWRT